MIKKFFLKIKEKQIFIVLLVSVIMFIILFLIFKVFYTSKFTDGMNQTGIINIYYKTYTKEKGWSKWSKNGMTSGDKKNNYEIRKIKFKSSYKKSHALSYGIYDTNKKYYEYSIDSKIKNQKITGLILSPSVLLANKYDLCYRTYNKKDGWLGWSCSYLVSGNANENITAIEVKIIPKNVIRNDYLKDYNKNLKNPGINFNKELQNEE